MAKATPKPAPKKKTGITPDKKLQSAAAIVKTKKASKVASRRVAGAQRAAQARQQKRRDSK